MKKLMTNMVNFLKEEDGVTAIEYGLIAAFTSIAIIAALKLLGPKLANIFDQIQAAFPAA